MLFGIIGGDRRQEELLALLRRDGYTVAACGVAGEMDWDTAVAAEVVILPLPLCKEGDTLNIEGPRRGAGALFRQLRRDQLILAGQVKPAQAALAAELDLKLVDYFQREELTVANAAATAEGTVQVILERLERSLLGSRCLVLGFGRIGKLLARKLRVLGADVTVSARKAQDLELARILGFRRIKTGNWAGALAQYDGIVNTVPAPVVIPEHLQSIRKDCALLELASLPGGFCTEAQALPGYLAARGLPGQYAPESAAAIIRSAIFRSLNQEEAS